MKEPSRVRNVQLNLRVSEKERSLIEEKMQALGTINREAYLRKMAIDGYIIKLELPELKEVISLMRRTSNNVNQIAKRLNETGRIYGVDVEGIQAQQERLWSTLNGLMEKLSSIQ